MFLRGRDAVQFGLDATRAGIIETTHAPMIVATLLSANRPRSQAELLSGLCTAGLSAEAARSLIDDLLAYRILIPCAQHSVIVLGRGPLAETTSTVLRNSGVVVRSPIRGESEFSYLASAEVNAPVLVIDRLAHAKAMAPMLTRFARTWLPGAVIDRRGLVGPVRIADRGPCPLCLDLHRTDTDAYWHRVVTQLPGGPSTPDAVVVAATAAQLAVWALNLLQIPSPAGVADLVLAPGSLLNVDPFGSSSRATLTTHPRCPVCFSFNQTR
ncbi:hypothetical protein C5L39_05285 [Corynebacterium alimapuense]|uniref:TOMM leader peptide-binding protein n=1 Tax=Corynebacterium alimapuense TaxID=1576874 RepID=A0A3M8K674_9CORY|nr:hypothetical protein C5L39_05285 [Corynebacterium alimapuense]